MQEKVHRCYIFSEEQEKFLRSKKYKIDRMECFLTLVDRVARVSSLVDISDHRQLELLKGQFIVTDTELSRLWKLDRKTCARLMKKMMELGMSPMTSALYFSGGFREMFLYNKSGAPDLIISKTPQTTRRLAVSPFPPSISVIHLL